MDRRRYVWGGPVFQQIWFFWTHPYPLGNFGWPYNVSLKNNKLNHFSIAKNILNFISSLYFLIFGWIKNFPNVTEILVKINFCFTIDWVIYIMIEPETLKPRGAVEKISE